MNWKTPDVTFLTGVATRPRKLHQGHRSWAWPARLLPLLAWAAARRRMAARGRDGAQLPGSTGWLDVASPVLSWVDNTLLGWLPVWVRVVAWAALASLHLDAHLPLHLAPGGAGRGQVAGGGDPLRAAGLRGRVQGSVADPQAQSRAGRQAAVADLRARHGGLAAGAVHPGLDGQRLRRAASPWPARRCRSR